MRLIPVLTAILVTAFLYLVVFERDRLLAFAAKGETAATEEETAKAPAPSEPDENAVGVVVYKSSSQIIDSAVVLRGQTEAARFVDVKAETSARVISLPLKKGSFVEAGQLLCQLDPGTREANLNEDRARLNEAKARVPEAQARLDEMRAKLDEARINDNAAAKLSRDGFASDTRVAGALAAVRAAEAGVQSAVAGLQSAESGIQAAEAAIAASRKEIERLTITAPFAGVLESDTAELGSLMQPGALCARVIQLDPIKLVGFVPETDVNRIEIGALAGAKLAAGDQISGKVTFLSRAADATTRTFRVEIDVPNPDLKIRDGQTAEILVSSDGEAAHLLPQSSLTLNDEGTLGVRLVTKASQALFQPVTLLRDTIDGVWVVGLPDESDVIVVGQEFVTDGVAVAATYKDMKK